MTPPEQNARFVAKMEDVLSVYQRPYDPNRPVVCMDEMSRQLLREVRDPIETKPGAPYRYDHHYERNGTVNLFTFFEPLASAEISAGRAVMVRERRTKTDWAECVRAVLDEHYPEAETVVLVMDNLNTHCLSSLYEAFAPEEARRLAERLEIHYTPEHGSWLNMAEIEQSVMARQALGRRVPSRAAMAQVTTWAERSLDAREHPFLVLDGMQMGDDTSPKVRRQGAVRSTTVLLAVGISDQGQREILGLDVAFGETERPGAASSTGSRRAASPAW